MARAAASLGPIHGLVAASGIGGPNGDEGVTGQAVDQNVGAWMG